MALLTEILFSEGSGSTAADSSGNSRTQTATNSGTAWTPDGYPNNAAKTEFSGLWSPNASQTAFTIMCWVKRTGTWSAWAAIFGHTSWYVEVDAGAGYNINFFGGTNSTNSGSTPLPLNEWTHIAVTYGGGNSTLYINGIQKGSVVANPAQNFGTGNWYIVPSVANAGEDSTIVANVSQFRTFDQVLSVPEIRSFAGINPGMAFTLPRLGAPTRKAAGPLLRSPRHQSDDNWTGPVLAESYVVNSAGSDTTTLQTPSFTPADGEVIVVKSQSQFGDASAIPAPSGGGLTYTQRQRQEGVTNHDRVGIWTTVVGTSPGAMTISQGAPGAASHHSMVVERWRNAQLASSPVSVLANSAAAGLPSTTLTTTQPNSVISWLNSDWNAVDGAARAYFPSANEVGYRFNSGAATFYWDSARAYTPEAVPFGLQQPGGQNWTLAGIEILPLGAAPSIPDVAGTPGIVLFEGVPGAVTPNIDATPAVVSFLGVAGAVRPDLTGTPGVVAFTGVQGVPAPNVNATPAVVNFTGVAGVPTPNIAGTPGVMVLGGVAGTVRPNLIGTPGAVAFAGVAGAVTPNITGTPGGVTWTGVAGTISVPVAVTGTPGVVNFAGVAGTPRPNLNGTPGIVAFTGQAGTPTPNLTATPGVLTFSGVAGSTAPTVSGVPGVVNFVGVAGVPRPNLTGTPGVVAFTGSAGTVRSDLVGTPGVVVFSGVAGVAARPGTPGVITFVGVPGIPRPNLDGTPGILVFSGVPGTATGFAPNINATPGILSFTGVSGQVISNIAGTPGSVVFGGVAGVPRINLAGTPGVLPFAGVPGVVRPNLVATPGIIAFVGVNGVFEPTKFYNLQVRLLDDRYELTVEGERYELLIPEGQEESEALLLHASTGLLLALGAGRNIVSQYEVGLQDGRYTFVHEGRYKAEVK